MPRGFRERYGPWAVITGASEGTGREFARQVAAEGLNCLLVARRETPLAGLADTIRGESGVEVATASIDLARPDAARLVAEAADGFEVGLFIANAGGDPNGSKFLDRDRADWIALAQRNVMTTLECCHRFGTAMRARGRGGLLLVNSGACYGGAPYLATYSATKAFQLCLGEGLWAELRPHGVDVLNLVMGETDTPELRKLLAAKGFPLPPDLADAGDVAAAGLAQLPNGPILNWGRADDEAAHGLASARDRRERVALIERISKPFFNAA